MFRPGGITSLQWLQERMKNETAFMHSKCANMCRCKLLSDQTACLLHLLLPCTLRDVTPTYTKENSIKSKRDGLESFYSFSKPDSVCWNQTSCSLLTRIYCFSRLTLPGFGCYIFNMRATPPHLLGMLFV